MRSFYVDSGINIQVLTLAEQALYTLSYLPGLFILDLPNAETL